MVLSGTHSAAAVSASGGSARAFVTPAAGQPTLLLDTSASPRAICALAVQTCPAGTGVSRVQLSASPAGGPVPAWPAVQIAFVIETTSYDGVLGTDRSDQLDVCANSGATAPACEESNGVPFFVGNAQTIANAIQAANPHSAVSFALVDYYDARGEPWDDTDGPEYNVDIGQFVPPQGFGSLVQATFQQSVMAGTWYSWDQDLDNNFLDSSSIAALYGAIVGSALNWTDGAHHVIVWMGSSAPRDPSYPENYCVSPSQWNIWGQPANCYSQTCEPSYTFETGASPMCEGWVHSQDGNPKDSIAALAHNAPACVNSVGGMCTVDTIDLWTTTTDPLSAGWPSAGSFRNQGGGPGGPAVQVNTINVLQAGCDLAAATGGSWSGPSYFSCPNGQSGSLQYVPFGSSIYTPNLHNPTLLNAFRSISFGPVYGTEVARGTDQPMFQYVPIGNIAIAPNPDWTSACSTPLGFAANCPAIPVVLHHGAVAYFGWNWSSVAADNVMYLGDSWTASFNVVATGPPYQYVPVDACTTVACRAAGSNAIDGAYTLAVYLTQSNTTTVTQSFPVATVDVEAPTAVFPPAPLPPAVLPPPPGLPVLSPAPLPVVLPLTVVTQVGLTSVSLQATAAGFLAAGFMRVGLKNRPIAVRVAAKSGVVSSKFEATPRGETGVGRFV
jgi:hypothetical protein